MNSSNSSRIIKEIAIGAAILCIVGVLGHYADLPTKVAVLETTVSDVKDDIHDIKQMVRDLHERK